MPILFAGFADEYRGPVMAVDGLNNAMPIHWQENPDSTIIEYLHNSLTFEEDEQMVGSEYNTRITITELWE